jgi:ABC-type sugar transport system substrate-binding protein
MKRAIFLLAVIGAVAAVWFAANRFMEHPAGWFRERASSFAASVRKRGPGFIQDVAYGIEKAGEATELRAETLRERAQAEEN